MSKRPLEFGCAECPSLGKVFKIDTLNVHYRDYHNGIAVSKCGICFAPFSHRTSLIRHLKSDHEQQEENVLDNAACNSSGNVATTSNFGEDEDAADWSSDSSQSDCGDNDCEDSTLTDGVLVEERNPYPLPDLTSVADEIILELRATSKGLTHAAIGRFQKSYMKLIDAHSSLLKHKMFSSLRARGMSQSDIEQVLDEVHQIEDPFIKLGTIESQMDYYEEKYGLVKPEEFFLDSRIDNRLDPKTNEYLPTQVNESFEYVSIIGSLKLILSQKHNRDNIFKDFSSKDNILRSFMDGTDFKTHPLVLKYPNVILICLFYDDLEIASALGSKTIIHKLGVFSFQILNGPPHLLSKLSTVHLLALVHSDDLKKPNAFQKVLYKFIQDMKKLGSDQGVEIEIDGEPITMRAVLATVTADSLAAHELLAFLSPSARHFCRVCTISRPDFRLEGNLEAPLRTRFTHDQQVEEVKRNPSASTNYGIKGECCLNEVPYFHCVDGSVFDAFHDLLEGVVPAVIKMVLRQIIYLKGALSVAEFNMRVASFNYGIPDNKNKPSPNFHMGMLKGHDKVKQTGSQMWCLMRAFPFLLADCVEEGDLYMQVIFVTQDIMKIVFSFEVSPQDLEQLDTLIFTLNRMYKELFVDAPAPEEDEEDNNADDPDAELDPDDPDGETGEHQEQPDHPGQPRRRRKKKPLKVHLFNKLHHLKHYCYQMKKKGPIVRLWCAKFEGGLKIFRQYAATCCNFKNPPKTMAQMFQLSHLWSQIRSHEEENVIEYQSGSQRTPYETDHPELFIEAGMTTLIETNKAIVNGEEYRTGLFVVFKKPEEEPTFSLISRLYVVEETSVFFILKPWKVVELSNKYNAYRVVPDGNSPHSLRSVFSLTNFRPLAPWNSSSGNIYLSSRTQIL